MASGLCLGAEDVRRASGSAAWSEGGKVSRTGPSVWLERGPPSETAVTGGTQVSCVATPSP